MATIDDIEARALADKANEHSVRVGSLYVCKDGDDPFEYYQVEGATYRPITRDDAVRLLTPPLKPVCFPKCARGSLFAVGIASAAIIGAIAGFRMPLPEPHFDLVAVSATGDAYILDHGLTLSDCVGAWSDYPRAMPLRCASEFN